MPTKYQRLLTEALAATQAAKAIAETAAAENREMNDAERADFNAKGAEIAEKRAAAEIAKADEAVLAQARELADLIGPEAAADVLDQKSAEPGRDTPSRKSLGEQFVNSPQFKRMLGSFTSEDGRVNINEKMRVQSDPVSFKSLIRQKALLVGGSSTSVGGFVVPERTDIVEKLGRRPLTIRDLISLRRTTSDTVEYVKQLAHTNAAAPVAEATSSAAPTTGASAGAALTLDPNGGYKPEGSWTFQKATAVVKTIAEWVPATKRALADVAALEGLINDELVADLQETEEAQILTGNGTGENLQGIIGTSGIQTMAAVTTNDATWLASFRTAVRMARTIGRVNPSAIVVNPTQGEKIDVTKDSQNRFYGNGPFGPAIRTLWGVPVVESEAITAGTALLGDFSKAVLWDREQSTISATDSHADFFIRNLVAILAEERVAFATVRPSAFVTVTGL